MLFQVTDLVAICSTTQKMTTATVSIFFPQHTTDFAIEARIALLKTQGFSIESKEGPHHFAVLAKVSANQRCTQARAT